jgi:gamma-glutamylcyclotransferase (GGCT)/AIG2-like uncharacterized protein YtfP
MVRFRLLVCKGLRMQYPMFVYGTLKRGGSNYDAYLKGKATTQNPAFLPAAALYNCGPYPCLVLDAGAGVFGELVEFDAKDYATHLAAIDSLEDYTEGGEKNMYERVLVDIDTATGSQQAWVYVAGADLMAQIRAGELPFIDNGNWPI